MPAAANAPMASTARVPKMTRPPSWTSWFQAIPNTTVPPLASSIFRAMAMPLPPCSMCMEPPEITVWTPPWRSSVLPLVMIVLAPAWFRLQLVPCDGAAHHAALDRHLVGGDFTDQRVVNAQLIGPHHGGNRARPRGSSG